MEKSQLRSGDIVRTREGNKYIVLLKIRQSEEVLINLLDGYYLDLSEYNEDLTHVSYSYSDIVAVCAFDYVGNNLRQHGLTALTADYEWTWEREDKKEMTISEIEKE